MVESRKIVIIGASYAGVLALKTIVDKASQYKQFELDIVVVAPNDKSFYNVAAPRLLIESDKIDQVLFPVGETIAKILGSSSHKAEFMQGYVEEIDFESRSIVVNNCQSPLRYDYLIIASGSRSITPAWKLDNKSDQSICISSLKSLSLDINSADTIAVIGGGSTGIEVAGELASFKQKKITLYSGSQGVLSSAPSFSSKVETQLKKLGVELIKKNVDIHDNIIKCDSETKQYDLVIQAQKLTPNTEFMPTDMLKDGFIETDAFFRLKSFPNVIALGDVLSIGAHSLVDLSYNQKGIFEKVVSFEIFKDESISLKPYQRMSTTTMIVPIGRNGGVGALFGVPIPSILVWFLKSKDFMISKAKQTLSV